MEAKTKPNWWFFVPIAIIAILFLPVLLLGYAMWHLVLLLSVWILWCAKGRKMLFVWSESPTWQEYIQANYLSRFNNTVVVLNRSERATWRISLATLAFKHWGGRQNFNPLAVVFRPFKRTQVFRFHEAFIDFKHGKPEKLKQVESDFFAQLQET